MKTNVKTEGADAIPSSDLLDGEPNEGKSWPYGWRTPPENSLEDLAMKAITSLYIAVDASIANDLKQRVGAYICQLKREREEAVANTKYWLNQHADEVERREKAEVQLNALEAENVRRIRHLNRLATWAQQDPTGPLPEWRGAQVQSWVLNEIRSALGSNPEPQPWTPECLPSNK